MSDLHPTVEACAARGFCDATFAAAERRLATVTYLLDHIHGNEHTGAMAGCQKCLALIACAPAVDRESSASGVSPSEPSRGRE